MKLLLNIIPTPILLFLLGAVGYPIIELAWRGRTHWTMSLAGGISMVLLLLISRSALPLPLMWLSGALAITAVEFSIGCVVNLGLHWEIWDYSKLPMNLLGQVCLPFTAVWFVLSIPAVSLCQIIDRAAG
ncbi:MAG: hypothetical protein IJX76_03350 [Clostridia bacterium]|nr:hypothetical protein [Clostridia bacterium]